MKSIISDKDTVEQERVYPWIGIHKGIVVLFNDHKSGTLLRQDQKFKLGGIYEVGDYMCGNIVEENFVTFDGQITLSN